MKILMVPCLLVLFGVNLQAHYIRLAEADSSVHEVKDGSGPAFVDSKPANPSLRDILYSYNYEQAYERKMPRDSIRRKREAEEELPPLPKMPDAPVLLPLNYDNLPDYIREAISSTEKAETNKQTDNPYVNPQLDPEEKKEMDEKMEEMFAAVQPVENITRTYGMNLSSDGGHVWNDLVNPPVSYDVETPNSNREEISRESTTNAPTTSEQPKIQTGSEPIESIIPVEPEIPFEPKAPTEPVEPESDKPKQPLEPVAPLGPTPPDAQEKPFEPKAPNENIEPVAPFEPKPDESNQSLGPFGPIAPPPIGNPEGPTEPLVPVGPTIPLEPSPEKPVLSLEPIGPIESTSPEPELPNESVPVTVQPDEEHSEVKDPAGREEGNTPRLDKPSGETEDQLEEEEHKHPDQEPEDIMNKLLKSEQFWKWLGEWTATYMELLEKHIRKIAIQEICNHEKAGIDMCQLEETGPAIKDGKLLIDGKEIPITRTDNLHLQRRRGESSGSKVDATTIYGNSVGNEKVTNVFIFNPDQTKEILEEVKPENGPVNVIIDDRIKEEIKEPSPETEKEIINEKPEISKTEEKGGINERMKELGKAKEIADVKEKIDADKPVPSKEDFLE